MDRYVTSLSTALGVVIAIILLVTVACGGTSAPADDSNASDTGASNAATGSGTGGGSGAGGGSAGAQPQATTALATPTPRPTIVPGATQTPLPAALPSELIANPVTKDAYSDAQLGGILRRGGYAAGRVR